MHKYLSDIDILGLLVASLCHDINHPGHGNDFEIKIESDLALLYNDVSVLENMHAHETFLILKKEDSNLFMNISATERKELRKIIINAVLATDMTHHKDFTTVIGDKRSADEAFDVKDSNLRQLLVDTVIHAADISAQVYTWEVAQQWEERINREFRMQVEKEKVLGLTPNSFMAELDDPVKRYKSQLFFCEAILKPFWVRLARLFPFLGSCVKQLERNKAKYQDLLNLYISPEERKKELTKRCTVVLSPLPNKKQCETRKVRSCSLDKLTGKENIVITRSQTDQ